MGRSEVLRRSSEWTGFETEAKRDGVQAEIESLSSHWLPPEGGPMNNSRNRPSPEEKERQYRSIFDAAADGLIVSDLETELVVEANPAACMMHGYTREEFIGLQLTAFIHPDRQPVFNEYLRGFQSDGVFDTRTLHVCRDGSTFYAEWRGTAFTYQGRPCLLGIVRDVSKRIQAEQLLGQRVETRTHE